MWDPIARAGHAGDMYNSSCLLHSNCLAAAEAVAKAAAEAVAKAAATAVAKAAAKAACMDMHKIQIAT